LTYDKALVGTLHWAQDEKKLNQIVLANADEEGLFKVSAGPGRYSLLIIGRAGFNDAVWLADEVSLEGGKETTIKLSSPKKSCLVDQ
jgi:hypothetical protein